MCVSRRLWLEPKFLNLDSSDQRTDFHRSNAHCSCFLAQASLFFLLVSFSSFFAATRPWRPDSCSLLWTVDVEMCLLLEPCEAFIWVAIWGAVNSNELVCSKGNSGSSFPVAVLMRANFLIALDGFCNYTWRKDCCFSLLIWAVLALIWTLSFTK